MVLRAAAVYSFAALRRGVVRAERALGHPAVLPAMLIAGAVLVGMAFLTSRATAGTGAYDAHAYWLAARSADPYASAIQNAFDDSSQPFTYRYPPLLIQVLTPIAVLPWPVFAGVWLGMLYLAFLWLAGRWALPLLLLFPAVLYELRLGNVNLLIAAASVIGFRWPAAWALPILTKITPGIGLLWFVFRGEFRSLAIALGVTAAGLAVSLVAAPGLWSAFGLALEAQSSAALTTPPLGLQVSLPIRFAVASLVILIAARTDRPWLVPVAVVIASPVIWFNVLVILVAIIPLLPRDSRWRRDALAKAAGSPSRS